MRSVEQLLAELDLYRPARQRLLYALDDAESNRDPLAEFAEHFVAALTGGALARHRAESNWDVELPSGERMHVRLLANPRDRWVHEHLVHRIPNVQWYVLVLFEDFQVSGVLAFPNDLGEVCALLGKRHPRQQETLQLTRWNWWTIRDHPETFVKLGMRVWLPPYLEEAGTPAFSVTERPRPPLTVEQASLTVERFLGVDLAWREDGDDRVANETGVVAIDQLGQVHDAGWTRGVQETLAWILAAAGDGPAMLFVDAPLVVDNPGGQRLCEKQVGQRYGRWGFSANTTNLASPRLAGVTLRRLLEEAGWRYSDGREGPPTSGRTFSECFPYTTLAGAPELGYYADGQRPRYKRKPRSLPTAQWRPQRAEVCDELVRRLAALNAADPPLRLDSHPVTQQLLDERSPLDDVAHKHREDLIDAAICAWTAALWRRHGLSRCQVLGPSEPATQPAATIIAPAAPDQRPT